MLIRFKISYKQGRIEEDRVLFLCKQFPKVWHKMIQVKVVVSIMTLEDSKQETRTLDKRHIHTYMNAPSMKHLSWGRGLWSAM